jgi:hypothetical protein
VAQAVDEAFEGGSRSMSRVRSDQSEGDPTCRRVDPPPPPEFDRIREKVNGIPPGGEGIGHPVGIIF